LAGRLDSVLRQIETGVEFLEKRYNAKSLILYYQAFSSTLGPVSELKKIYDSGLQARDFRELVVSTRPDCIDSASAALLGGYVRDGFDVWVELGLQSASNFTLRRIGRGHTVEQFDQAVQLLRGCGVKIAAHVIFGLPGEGEEQILNTVRHVAGLGIDGIKIHDLHIPRNSRLLAEYLLGEISIPAPGRHLDYTIAALELLHPDTVVMRLTCDTPVHSRALPVNPLRKGVFINLVQREMMKRATFQGRLYK
ncbi:MAG: TIGR01212 family radical SAM protein, partial [Spirochaetales bacterium]|nr:TIGR01212 family radical SAM protein [Spirochaetales bacterium]